MPIRPASAPDGQAMARTRTERAGSAVTYEQQLAVARIALAVCGRRGYALSGSLAIRAHGIIGARDADDIDVFVNRLLEDADTVRSCVAGALRTAGYQVAELRTWGTTPEETTSQNAELIVSHVRHASVTLQLVCTTRYLKPVDLRGMPVAALGQCLYDKLEALRNRVSAKDFIDLALLRAHIGPHGTEEYIRMYITGLARHYGRPEADVARHVHQDLLQVATVPHEALAAYGYPPARTRATVLALADRVAPVQSRASVSRECPLIRPHIPVPVQSPRPGRATQGPRRWP